MADQITIVVKDTIPAKNQATIDLEGQTGNTYTKTQLDQKLQDARSGFKGVAKLDTVPESVGNWFYQAIEVGTYPNFYNTVVTDEQLKENNVYFFTRDGLIVDIYISKKIDGLSAYEIAVKYGFNGNELAWYESIDESDLSYRTPTNPIVRENLKKIIHSIKLVDGFNYDTEYFISRIAYKEGGETGIYLMLRSLPNGLFDFEWRIQEYELKKGEPIKLNDTARNRTVILTISHEADDTFDQSVVNFEDSSLTKNAFYDNTWNLPLRQIKYTRVLIPNQTDYIIRNTIAGLREKANYYNRYVIIVPKGTYFEYDVRTQDYIDIEGVSAEDCIIDLDGNSSKIAPTDVTIGFGGVAINNIPQEFKHIFWHINNCEIRNLTLKVANVKYAIHQDAPKKSTATGNNLILVDGGNIVRLLGIGGWEGQIHRYKDCYFKNKIEHQAIGWHNWDGRTEPAMGEFINCKSDYLLINITELNSTQADTVRLVNCDVLNQSQGAVIFNVEPQDGTPPLNVPYCIKLFMEGNNLPISENNRPNYKAF